MRGQLRESRSDHVFQGTDAAHARYGSYGCRHSNDAGRNGKYAVGIGSEKVLERICSGRPECVSLLRILTVEPQCPRFAVSIQIDVAAITDCSREPVPERDTDPVYRPSAADLFTRHDRLRDLDDHTRASGAWVDRCTQTVLARRNGT